MHFRKLLPLLSILALGLIKPVPAVADVTTNSTGEAIQIFGVTQQDLNGDGAPDVTVIDCAFATGHDRVLVYDLNGDMPAGSQWEEITDFQDDVWVFDAGADGTAQLIVKFGVDGDRHTALVYDDLNGDGRVSYRIAGNQVVIEESRFWHVKVETDRPWTQPGGLFDTNVTFSIDGYDGLVLYLGSTAGDQNRGTDGVVDWQLNIGDKDGDGINDYQLQRAINPILIENYIQQYPTAIYAQANGRRPAPYSNTVFWPLLVGKHQYEEYRYFDHPPVIAVDWEAGIIDRIGILGFPIEDGYHIYSRLPLEKNVINAPNFENPMAYYDMANDQDGWAELQVRSDVMVPYDPYLPGYPYAANPATPNVEVNYSWDQDNDNRWDYKINLSANYPIDEVVQFPDFAVKSVPYDKIIPWVKNRTWDVAMLIFDDRPSPDSEGMFRRGWTMQRGYAGGEPVEPSGVKDEYLKGLSDRPPKEYYQDIQEGMRGEYNFRYFDTPKIYLSSLDRQLHLNGAQAGVWNLGEDHRLRYANLDGDVYLDQWQEEREGMVVQQLNYSDGIYVYSGNGGVQIRQTDVGPALLESQPPGNYEEWQRLDAQLKANQAAFPPEDFAGMLGLLTGPGTQIRGAVLREYRITPHGFRFVLELQPGFGIPLDQQNLASLLGAPGTYVIEYDGSAWSVRSATPASLQASNLRVAAQDGALQALHWTKVAAVVRNDGLEDAHDLPVCAVFAGPAGPQTVITDTVALLPGEGEQRVTWDWAPPAAGRWNVQVGTGCGAAGEDPSSAQLLVAGTVDVLPAPPTSELQAVTAFGLIRPWQWALLLAALALAGAALGWSALRALTGRTVTAQPLPGDDGVDP